MISLRGLPELTWLEFKIFMREPMGAFFTVAMPVIAFVAFGRILGDERPSANAAGIMRPGSLPALVALMVVISAVLSLVTIVSIYREGGILKRLRATPLRPYTILSAHVLVKLVLTAITMVVMIAAGKRYFPNDSDVPVVSFAVALLLSTWSVLSIGFVIASVVPTARFAQPVGAMIVYPMVAVSGLFVPIDVLPEKVQMVTRALPFTYVVSLLQGMWNGDAWSAHYGDVSALIIVFVICTAVSARVFRWE